MREESCLFCKWRREAFLLFHVSFCVGCPKKKIQLQVSEVSLTSNPGGDNISIIKELSNLDVEVCSYEIAQGKRS